MNSTTTENGRKITINFNQVPLTRDSMGRLARASVLTGARLVYRNATTKYQDTPNNRWRDTVDVEAILPANLAGAFATMSGFGLT